MCVCVCNQLLSSSGPESRGCAPQLVPPEGDDCQISDPATAALDASHIGVQGMTSLTRAEQLTSGASCRGDDVMPWRSDPGNAKSILGLLDQRQLPSNDIKADGFNEIS